MKTIRKVNQIINNVNMETNSQIKPLFNTIDFEAVFKACDTARRYHLMIGIIGDTGTGKTTSITEYSKKKNVFRISYEKSMNPRLFFSALLGRLGVDYEGRVYSEIDMAADLLKRMDNPLLIIDEAGKIPHALFLHLHDLRERTKDSAGIVLAGMPYFKSNLQKFSNRGKEGCSEFLRRINIWHELQGLSRDESASVAKRYGITEPEQLKEFSRVRRFGDLMNKILLEQVIKEEI